MKDLNDPLADHRVAYRGCGTNVRIPYKGYTIDLASDGMDTIVEDSEGNLLVGFDTIHGTSGESIREAMRVVDLVKGEV